MEIIKILSNTHCQFFFIDYYLGQGLLWYPVSNLISRDNYCSLLPGRDNYGYQLMSPTTLEIRDERYLLVCLVSPVITQT